MQKASLLPSPLRLITAIAMLCLAGALGLYALFADPLKLPGSGEALIGGPFSMTNHRGEIVTEKTYLGRPMLLVFGFTFCPDVCPTELQVTTQALANLGSAGESIQPLFVSIDPERDKPDVLAAYVANFSPRLVGLTGTPEQVATMAAAYRVFYEKRPNQEDPAAYSMDHSSIIYLMDARGKFIKHFSYTTDPKLLSEGISNALAP